MLLISKIGIVFRLLKLLPVIISKDIFDKTQALMADRAPTKIHPRRTASRFLLSGLAVCGDCGRALVGLDAKSGKYSYYVCNSLPKKGAGSCSTPYLNIEKFERLVISNIKKHILTLENITELVKLVNEEMVAVAGDSRSEIETINSEISGVEQRLGNLYNAIESSAYCL